MRRRHTRPLKTSPRIMKIAYSHQNVSWTLMAILPPLNIRIKVKSIHKTYHNHVCTIRSATYKAIYAPPPQNLKLSQGISAWIYPSFPLPPTSSLSSSTQLVSHIQIRHRLQQFQNFQLPIRPTTPWDAPYPPPPGKVYGILVLQELDPFFDMNMYVSGHCTRESETDIFCKYSYP